MPPATDTAASGRTCSRRRSPRPRRAGQISSPCSVRSPARGAGWYCGRLSPHDLARRQQLDARVRGPRPRRAPDARRRGLPLHLARARRGGDEHADRGALALDHAPQVAHVAHARRAALDRDHDLPVAERRAIGVSGIAIGERRRAVDAAVRPPALGAAARGAAEPGDRPELVLVLVALRQRERRRLVGRLAVHARAVRLVLGEVAGKGRPQPVPHQVHGEPGDVDADPAPPQPVRRHRRRPAPAERIEHEVAGVRGRLDDPLQQRLRLLRAVAEVLLRAADGRNVGPDILERHARHLVEVALVARNPRSRVVEAALALEPLHVLARVRPVAVAVGQHLPPVRRRPLVAGVAARLGRREVAQLEAPPGLRLDVPVEPLDVLPGVRAVLRVPGRLPRPRVEEDGVGDAPEVARALTGVAVRRGAPPHDLVAEVAGVEHGVHQRLEVVARGRVAVEVDRGGRLHHAPQLDEARRHHRQVRRHVVVAERFDERAQQPAYVVPAAGDLVERVRGVRRPVPRVLERRDLRLGFEGLPPPPRTLVLRYSTLYERWELNGGSR